jgi:hypothetical protein
MFVVRNCSIPVLMIKLFKENFFGFFPLCAKYISFKVNYDLFIGNNKVIRIY